MYTEEISLCQRLLLQFTGLLTAYFDVVDSNVFETFYDKLNPVSYFLHSVVERR